VNVSPRQTRRKTAHEATKENPMEGTAIQWACRPIHRPKSAFRSVPRRGKNGISQTVLDTDPL
jgi:hypothetical protein